MSVNSQLQETRTPGWALPVCSSAGPPSCLNLLGDRDEELGLGQGETLSWQLSLGGVALMVFCKLGDWQEGHWVRGLQGRRELEEELCAGSLALS